MTENGLPFVMSPVQLVPFQYSMPPPPILMGPPPPPTMSPASGTTGWGINDWQGLLCQQQLHQQQMQHQQQISNIQQQIQQQQQQQQIQQQQQQQIQQQQQQQQIQQQQQKQTQPQQQQSLVGGSVASYSLQMPWGNGVQFASPQQSFSYSRPPTTTQNDGFAVPWPPRARFNKNKLVANKYRKGNEGSVNGEGRRRRKKKSLFEEYISTKPWNKEDATKALKVETELQNERTEKTVIIRFPDPELSKPIVQKYHPDIKSVHFQAPSDQRFCYVHLEDDVDVDEVIESLNKTKFGTGYLTAERKPVTNQKCDGNTDAIECIDPYTLYVGNLPANTTTMTLLEHFPTSTIIKISQEQRVISHMWAFVAFKTVDLAIEALKSASNLKIDNRNIAVRFRRGAKPLNAKNKEPLKNGSSTKETFKPPEEMIEPKKEPEDDYEVIGCGVDIDDEYDEEQSVDDELDSVMGDYDQDYDDEDDDSEFVAHQNGYHDDYEDDDDEVMAFHSLPIIKCKTERESSVDLSNNDDDDDDDTDVWRLR